MFNFFYSYFMVRFSECSDVQRKLQVVARKTETGQKQEEFLKFALPEYYRFRKYNDQNDADWGARKKIAMNVLNLKNDEFNEVELEKQFNKMCDTYYDTPWSDFEKLSHFEKDIRLKDMNLILRILLIMYHGLESTVC